MKQPTARELISSGPRCAARVLRPSGRVRIGTARLWREVATKSGLSGDVWRIQAVNASTTAQD